MNQATLVFRQSLERLAQETGLEDAAGFFPQNSELRRIASELIVFLASGRALMLQVAHPTVGQGVHDHSNFRTDALGRGFRTFGALYIMGFGRQAVAMKVAVKVYKIHQQIKGTFPADEDVRAGKKYSAMERDANMWVMATLLEGTKFAYDEIDPSEMRGRRLSNLYRDFRLLGRFFNIREDEWPPTYAEFQEYFNDMVAHRLTVTPSARKVAKALQNTKRLPYAPGNWLLHVLAAETLPENIRADFGIHRSAATKAAYQALRKTFRTVHKKGPVKQLPLYLIPALRLRFDRMRHAPNALQLRRS